MDDPTETIIEPEIVSAPPKKRNTALWIVIIVVVLLMLCCCAIIVGILGYFWTYGDAIFNIGSVLSFLLG